MKIEIIILFVLFILHLVHLFKSMEQLKPTLLYANSVLESARILQKYYELKKNINKYPILKEFIEHKINLIDIFSSATSFNEITVVRATKKEKWNGNKMKQLISEIDEAPEEIKILFFKFTS